MKIIIITIAITVLSFSGFSQHKLSIVGSGDDSKVRLVEFLEDHKKTTLYDPLSEVKANDLLDSLSVVYSQLDGSLEDHLQSYIEVIDMKEKELIALRRMKRKIERRIIIRDSN